MHMPLPSTKVWLGRLVRGGLGEISTSIFLHFIFFLKALLRFCIKKGLASPLGPNPEFDSFLLLIVVEMTRWLLIVVEIVF